MDLVGASDASATGAPAAVLLDAGGVFVLPEHHRILGAFERAGWTPPAGALDAAHYRAAVGFSVEADAESDWAGCWQQLPRGLRRGLRHTTRVAAGGP